MDQVQLRYDIFQILDEWEAQEDFKPDTIDNLKSIITKISGNKLYVLYLMFKGFTSQKEISETVGISPAAVSKILKNDKQIAQLNAILLFSSEKEKHELHVYDEKQAIQERSGKRRSKYRSPWKTLTPDELFLTTAQANDLVYEDGEDDYTDGNAPGTGKDAGYGGSQGGHISGPGIRFGGSIWDAGETGPDPYSRKRTETIQVEAIKNYHKELRAMEKAEKKKKN